MWSRSYGKTFLQMRKVGFNDRRQNVLQPSIKKLGFALKWLDLSRAMSDVPSNRDKRMYQVDDVAEIFVADSCMDVTMVGRNAGSIV